MSLRWHAGSIARRESTSGEIPDERWEELLAAAQRGDADAYRRFLRAVTPFVRAVARRKTGWSEGIEDVVQETLLTVHRVRHSYEPGRPVRPWLAAIAARRSIDALRARGRVRARESNDEAAYETYSPPETNEAERHDEARRIGRMIEALPPRQKEAIELVKLGEMSHAEASAASGQSIGSLKVNVHRAIRRMRGTALKGGEG